MLAAPIGARFVGFMLDLSEANSSSRFFVHRYVA
jgi:hypothetical protein